MKPPMERREVVKRLEKLKPKIAEVFSFERGKDYEFGSRYDQVVDSFTAMNRHRDKIASQLMPDGRQAGTMRKIADLIEDVKRGKADPEKAVQGIHWEITTLHAQAEKTLEHIRNIIDETNTDLYTYDNDQDFLERAKAHMTAPARHVTSTIRQRGVIDELDKLLTELASRNRPPKKTANAKLDNYAK